MAGQQPDPTGAKILDAAVRVLGDFGFKRATVELVAKYAGVSHMTIYRRWPSKSELLSTAVLQEFTTLLDAAFDPAETTDRAFADRTLAAFAEVVWGVRNNPLIARELNTESGDLLPLLPTTSAAVMETAVPLVADRLQRLGAGGTDTPVDDLDLLADVFVRLAHSLVLVDRPGRRLTTRAELVGYARDCFGPYLNGVAAEPEPTHDEAQVIDLESRRSPDRRHRVGLQVAAAALLGVLVLSAGLSAVLGSTGRLPFITPANMSETQTPAGGNGSDTSRTPAEPSGSTSPRPLFADRSEPQVVAPSPGAAPIQPPVVSSGSTSRAPELPAMRTPAVLPPVIRGPIGEDNNKPDVGTPPTNDRPDVPPPGPEWPDGPGPGPGPDGGHGQQPHPDSGSGPGGGHGPQPHSDSGPGPQGGHAPQNHSGPGPGSGPGPASSGKGPDNGNSQPSHSH